MKKKMIVILMYSIPILFLVIPVCVFIWCTKEYPAVKVTLSFRVKGSEYGHDFFVKRKDNPEGSLAEMICADGLNSSSVLHYSIEEVGSEKFKIKISGYMHKKDKRFHVDESFVTEFMVNDSGNNDVYNWAVVWYELEK